MSSPVTVQLPARVFISYAPADEAHATELENHLSALKREGLIEPWSKAKLLPGQHIDEALKQVLNEASLVLFGRMPRGKGIYLQTIAEQVWAHRHAGEHEAGTIRELSTPLIPLDAGIAVMPLVGRLDRVRAQQLLERLLEGVMTYQAKTIIVDITGVPVVDADVADALIRAAQAVKLLGAQAPRAPGVPRARQRRKY